ncbi:hypothetical protein [Pseudomonas sp.]|jgi:hypothetical protein|uniref:hypothetical protein n=1 Tax=Pseudomonas sp. TaxID=306 RepID=UPI002EDB4926
MTAKTDYDMTPQQASDLSGWAQMQLPDRVMMMTHYAATYGQAKLVELFAQFMGMACSVTENCKEMTDTVLVSEYDAHPDRVESINLPTIIGACQGVMLAGHCDDPAGACYGCAYRIGSVANQSPDATSDAEYQLCDPRGFLCHAEVDDDGNPTKVCVGHAKAAKALQRAGDEPAASSPAPGSARIDGTAGPGAGVTPWHNHPEPLKFVS